MPAKIKDLADIKLLVDAFYEKVRKDEVLAGIFETTIRNNWPVHLEKMYRFWQTVLLDDHTYSGSPFAPHARLPIGAEHFERWLHLFFATIDEHFEGARAEEAKWRASKMAEMFQYKLSYFQQHPEKLVK